MKRKILLFFLFLSFCKTTEKIELDKILNERIIEPFIDTKELTISVITNRNTTNITQECNNKYFRNAPSAVKYLSCAVNVPREHSIGVLETSNNVILDKNKFFFSTNIQTLNKESFYKNLKNQKEILIFVHGFNVEFEEAIYRIAQIHYDLKFQGTSIVFTWPAGSHQEGFLSNLFINETYKKNQENAKLSIPVFKEFIQELIASIDKDTNLYLIVHSMGHQIVIPALVDLSQTRQNKIIFKEIVFNAPDYPVDSFRNVVDHLRACSKRITIYCSPNDNALKASETVNGTRRIGQCYKIPGIDVINVQRVDSPIMGIGGLGHGYYSSRSILTDLYQLFLGMDAKKRLFITKSTQSTEDFILRD